jgi:hypothetical protein
MQADQIRAFVLEEHVKLARQRGMPTIQIRAGDVHRAMNLTNAMPAVCSALGSSKFETLSGTRLIHREGPRQGANVLFTFKLEPNSRTSVITRRQSSPRQSPKPQSAEMVDFKGALVLISCVKSKRATAAPARELYTSPLFTMARDLAEGGAEIRILSALHGLLEPQQLIEPYELSLNQMGVAERRAWAKNVLAKLMPLAERFDRVIFFAGERYREFLVEPLRSAGLTVEIPMAGLRQGEQLSWLRRHLR